MYRIHLSLIFIEAEKMRAYNKQGATYIIDINIEKNILHEVYKTK